MKKSRDYPLCGPRERRYNDRCDMGRRVATNMTLQCMPCQGVMTSAAICGNPSGKYGRGNKQARRNLLRHNNLRA